MTYERAGVASLWSLWIFLPPWPGQMRLMVLEVAGWSQSEHSSPLLAMFSQFCWEGQEISSKKWKTLWMSAHGSTLAFSLTLGLAETPGSGGTEFLLLLLDWVNSGLRGGTLLFLDFSVSFLFPLPLSLLTAKSGDQLDVLFTFFFILFWLSVWGSSVRNLTCFFALFSLSLAVTTMLGSCWLLGGVNSLPSVHHHKHN